MPGIGGLPPLLLFLALVGVSLSAVFLLGQGLAPGRQLPWLNAIGHAALVCLAVCCLYALKRLWGATGSARLNWGLGGLAFAVALALLYRHLFRPGGRGRIGR